MPQLFNKGQRFQVVDILKKPTGKFGVITYLRDDHYEKENNHKRDVYYYHVEFDDGSVETYLNQNDIISA